MPPHREGESAWGLSGVCEATDDLAFPIHRVLFLSPVPLGVKSQPWSPVTTESFVLPCTHSLRIVEKGHHIEILGAKSLPSGVLQLAQTSSA